MFMKNKKFFFVCDMHDFHFLSYLLIHLIPVVLILAGAVSSGLVETKHVLDVRRYLKLVRTTVKSVRVFIICNGIGYGNGNGIGIGNSIEN